MNVSLEPTPGATPGPGQGAQGSWGEPSRFFEEAPLACITVSFSTRQILEVNRRFLDDMGLAREDVIGRRPADLGLMPPARIAAFLDALWRQGRVEDWEAVVADREGRPIHVLLYAQPVILGEERALLIMSRNVTAERRTQAALRESEEHYRMLVHSVDAVVWEADPETFCFTYVSPQAERVFGYPASDWYQEGFWADHVFEDDRDETVNACLTATMEGRDHTLEYRMVHQDGRAVWVRDVVAVEVGPDGRPCALRGVIIDDSQHREAEKARAEVLRLDSLRVLSAGVAHDFNNLLLTILGNAGIARREIDDEAVQQTLAEIELAAQRAADLARQLLDYGGSGSAQMALLDVNDLLAELARILRTSVGERTELELDLAPGPQRVRGDPTQLRQVLMNLVINAAEAVGTGSGTIRVSTARSGAVARRSARLPALAGGEYVAVSISDDGCGMDEATQARIFEPFFTTKFTGRGLGLASALGIVRRHGGDIRVQSAPGKGTLFTIFLPQVVAPAVHEQDG